MIPIKPSIPPTFSECAPTDGSIRTWCERLRLTHGEAPDMSFAVIPGSNFVYAQAIPGEDGFVLHTKDDTLSPDQLVEVLANSSFPRRNFQHVIEGYIDTDKLIFWGLRLVESVHNSTPFSWTESEAAMYTCGFGAAGKFFVLLPTSRDLTVTGVGNRLVVVFVENQELENMLRAGKNLPDASMAFLVREEVQRTVDASEPDSPPTSMEVQQLPRSASTYGKLRKRDIEAMVDLHNLRVGRHESPEVVITTPTLLEKAKAKYPESTCFLTV